MTKTKWVAAFCIHGEHQDEKANQVLRAFIEDYQPEVRICGGDLFDLAPLRRNANAEDKALSMKADIAAGLAWCEWFKPHVWLHGNHDFRLYDRLDGDDGITRDLCQGIADQLKAELDGYGCEQHPYHHDQGYYLDEIRFIHGELYSVNAAKMMTEYYRNRFIVQGHAHTIQSYKGKNGAQAYIAGCLCDKGMAYASRRRNSNRWESGFAWGWSNPRTGAATINIASPDEDGVWSIMTEGKTYEP